MTAVRSPAGELSALAQGLVGSEILKIGGEVRELMLAGKPICNLSVGDFDPRQFPIPRRLADRIKHHIGAGETNYAPPAGMPELRKAVAAFYKRWLGFETPLDTVMIAAGGRPVIYGLYRTLVNPGDRVVFPVPSWNNQYYCNIVGAEMVEVPCGAATDFLPTAGMLEDAVRGATLLVLNTPSNPTGTLMSEQVLADICDLVLEENARRGSDERPLWLMYDQMYWMLTFGDGKHVNPVSLRPEMQRHTLFVDGISKSFASTGLRVGWGVGPAHVMRSMTDLLAHVGAGAPRAEQLASADMLGEDDEMEEYRQTLVRGLQERLSLLQSGIKALQRDGFAVDTTSPRGTIYLSAQFALHGKRTPDGGVLETNEAIRRYLLHSCGLAAIPFSAFGGRDETGWFRLSAGAVTPDEVRALMPRLREALGRLAS